jgi:hypothetical protein
MLGMAFHAIKRDAAPGVDGMTWENYEKDLAVCGKRFSDPTATQD